MTLVDSPKPAIRKTTWLWSLQESVGNAVSDPFNHESWLAQPFRLGMPIIVIAAPTGVEGRRSDLIGMRGELIDVIVKAQGERACQFRMTNGEIVTGKQIWWNRM